jgi:hypothetical protein
MIKRWFQFVYSGNGIENNTGRNNGSANVGLGLKEAAESERPSDNDGLSATDGPAPGQSAFEQIYQCATVKPRPASYSILKVADMMNSPHLSGMAPEARRSALLMALEAAGAEIEDLLQDAVVRQRALNDFEEAQEDRLRRYESAKTDENQAIQGELDRFTNQFMARIQANLEEVAHQQDSFRAWQKRKQQEAQRITDAATCCVPTGSTGGTLSLASVLERASLSRR